MTLTPDVALCILSAGCFLIAKTESINFMEPITPDVYQGLIGPGFAVKYFSRPEIDTLKTHFQGNNMRDLYNAGFSNVRIRCGAKYYPYPYTSDNFTTFLNGLGMVVDSCLDAGIIPIISWANGDAAALSTEGDLKMYLRWWNKVAKKLRNKDFRLGFNLVTELLPNKCKQYNTCDTSITSNRKKYNRWTQLVVDKIRSAGGNNAKRILILGSPQKGAQWLGDIDKNIYQNDTYMMAEYHTYAAGPTGKAKSGRSWDGCGNATQLQYLPDNIETANRNITLRTYWGAWMTYDNKHAGVNQTECECFAKHFVSTMKKYGIPWSLNALEHFYNTETSTWLTEPQTRSGGVVLNMSRILDVIKEYM